MRSKTDETVVIVETLINPCKFKIIVSFSSSEYRFDKIVSFLRETGWPVQYAIVKQTRCFCATIN